MHLSIDPPNSRAQALLKADELKASVAKSVHNDHTFLYMIVSKVVPRQVYHGVLLAVTGPYHRAAPKGGNYAGDWACDLAELLPFLARWQCMREDLWLSVEKVAKEFDLYINSKMSTICGWD